MEILTLLVPWPMHAVNATPAALFRSVADKASRRTILFDEIDTIFGPRAKELGVLADSIVKPLAKLLGGSGGGSAVFAQGGGPLQNKIGEAQKLAADLISSSSSSSSSSLARS